MARRHAEAALSALVEVVGDRQASPAARISAASTLLNWGFSKSGAAGDEAGNGPTELVIRWLDVLEGQTGWTPQTGPAGRSPQAKPTP